MTPELISYTFVITLFILVSALSLPAASRKIRALKFHHESLRFQRDPRVGDKAGYLYGPDPKRDVWMVGVVTHVERRFVALEVKIITALGTECRRPVWPIEQLRYFPPDTPLGVLDLNQLSSSDSGR